MSSSNGHARERRSHVVVSPQVQALLKLVAVVASDGETARALIAARMSESRAASALGLSCAALRQRVTRLVGRVESAFPGYRFLRGASPALRLGYDNEQLETLAGDGTGV